jgi:hypothetical protein
MKINLKDFAKQKEELKYIQKVISNEQMTKALAKKLNNHIKFLENIETDLELGGESIVELDMPRLDAIEERNKMLTFLNTDDEF